MNADIVEFIKVIGVIATVISTFFGIIKWTINTKIIPLQEKCKEQLDINSELKIKVHDLEKLIVDELKQISKDNFNFRREYENGLNEMKLVCVEKYTTKQDFVREMTDVHKRIDISHDTKKILESLKQLNS